MFWRSNCGILVQTGINGDALTRSTGHIARVHTKARADPVPALKQQLAREIIAATDGFSQWNIASAAGIDQPRVSDLKRGRIERFTLDRLVRILARLDHDVALDVRHRTGKGIFSPRCADSRRRNPLR